MKRDMDLIRLLLLEVESETKADLTSYDINTINFHKLLLLEAGYVDGPKPTYGFKGKIQSIEIDRLTWLGYEFLDEIRDKTTWAKVKKSLVENGLSISANLIIQSCLSLSESLLKKI